MSRNWNPLLAVGAGVMAGTTGILMYHYLVRKRFLIIPEQDVDRLYLSLECLRTEFEELKEDLKNDLEELKNLRRRNERPRRARRNYNNSAASTLSITDASMYSAVESDLDDEFCDFSNSEEDTKLNLR